jgi:hypothetical protein
MGKKIVQVLRQLHFESIVVDTALIVTNDDMTGKCYGSIDDLPAEDTMRTKAWFICTPTATHFQILRKILNQFPLARIMVEKPACRTDQVNSLFQFRKELVLENVWVNNHYDDCQNLKDASAFLKLSNSRCRKIVIDFCKDRAVDVANGRFVDKDLMIWGYEGFHMLNIAIKLMSDENAKDFIEMQGTFKYFKGLNNQISWVAEHGVLASGLTVLMRTTTDGSIFYPSLKRRFLKKKQRLRRVTVHLENGVCLFLIFGEHKKRKFEAAQDYCFGWHDQSNNEKYEFWRRENPLSKHVSRFLEQEGDLISKANNFSYALDLTKRLSYMAAKTYSTMDDKSLI